MDRIRAAVRKAKMFVVLGYSERCRGSIYIAQVSITLRSSTKETLSDSYGSPSSTQQARLYTTAARSSQPMSNEPISAMAKQILSKLWYHPPSAI